MMTIIKWILLNYTFGKYEKGEHILELEEGTIFIR